MVSGENYTCSFLSIANPYEYAFIKAFASYRCVFRRARAHSAVVWNVCTVG